MLDPKRFQDLNSGIEKFRQIIKSQIELLGGTLIRRKTPKRITEEIGI